MHERMAVDCVSQRHKDENGFLHVAVTHISKEAVNDYYGREVPGWQALNLDPGRIYRGYRPGEELKKAAPSFDGLPLLKEHVPIDANDLSEAPRAGNLGTTASFDAPYLNNGLIIQDADSIEALNPKDGSRPKRQLSAAYRYDPVFTPGRFNGENYDFIMTNIRGNHVALVEEGRAGPDVVVADAQPQLQRGKTMTLDFIGEIKKLIGMAEAKGASPELGGEKQTRESMYEEQNKSTGDSDRAGLGKRALAVIGTLESGDVADYLKSLVEERQGLAAEDEDLPLKHEDALPEGEEGCAAGAEEKAAAAAAAAGEEGEDGEDGEEAKTAMDVKLSASRRNAKAALVAMDAAAAVRKELRAVAAAAKKVEPLVGSDIDPFAFDSAAGVFAKAMELNGFSPKKYQPSAYEGIVDVLLKQRAASLFPSRAGGSLGMDGTPAERAPQFKHLSNIRH